MPNWTPRTDLDPRHYQFDRRCPGFHPPRETHEDRIGDRMVVIVSAIVLVLLLTGVLS